MQLTGCRKNVIEALCVVRFQPSLHSELLTRSKDLKQKRAESSRFFNDFDSRHYSTQSLRSHGHCPDARENQSQYPQKNKSG
jgi:hypothetical protein